MVVCVRHSNKFLTNFWKFGRLSFSHFTTSSTMNALVTVKSQPKNRQILFLSHKRVTVWCITIYKLKYRKWFLQVVFTFHIQFGTVSHPHSSFPRILFYNSCKWLYVSVSCFKVCLFNFVYGGPLFEFYTLFFSSSHIFRTFFFVPISGPAEFPFHFKK